MNQKLNLAYAKKIKTVEDAYKALDLDPSISGSVEDLEIIIKALNKGWSPNWDDSEERKYYVYVYMRNKAVSLLSVLCYYGRSGVPSRLCFKSRELAEYAIKNFKELFIKYYHA